VTGTSNVSWKDAIIQTVNEVAKTISNITSIKILDQRAKISVNKLIEYYVDLDVAFLVDKDR